MNDDRLINAIAAHTKGDELECDKEFREDAATWIYNALRPSDPAQQLANLKKIVEGANAKGI